MNIVEQVKKQGFVTAELQKEKDLIVYPYVKLTHEALVRAFSDTYEVIGQVAREKGVATLDLAQKMNGREEFFADHVHTTPKGSEEIAKTVAGFFLKQMNDQEIENEQKPTILAF